MKSSQKPVRKCHACEMNMGDHCWLYRYPRGQWRPGKSCQAMEDEKILAEFRDWQKDPTVKTLKELRRGFFRSTKRTEIHYSKRRRRLSS